jgi:hypothetical protein
MPRCHWIGKRIWRLRRNPNGLERSLARQLLSQDKYCMYKHRLLCCSDCRSEWSDRIASAAFCRTRTVRPRCRFASRRKKAAYPSNIRITLLKEQFDHQHEGWLSLSLTFTSCLFRRLTNSCLFWIMLQRKQILCRKMCAPLQKRILFFNPLRELKKLQKAIKRLNQDPLIASNNEIHQSASQSL